MGDVDRVLREFAKTSPNVGDLRPPLPAVTGVGADGDPIAYEADDLAFEPPPPNDMARVWSVPVTVIIVAATFEDAFEAICAALHEDGNVQTVGSNGGAVEDVEGTEELHSKGNQLRWSCGELVQPGETYHEHVKGCLAGEEKTDA